MRLHTSVLDGEHNFDVHFPASTHQQGRPLEHVNVRFIDLTNTKHFKLLLPNLPVNCNVRPTLACYP